MRWTLTRGERLRVDLEPAGQLRPAVAGNLGQGEELAALAGAEGLPVAAEDQGDVTRREGGEGHVVGTGVAVGGGRRRRGAGEEGGQPCRLGRIARAPEHIATLTRRAVLQGDD